MAVQLAEIKADVKVDSKAGWREMMWVDQWVEQLAACWVAQSVASSDD